MKISSLVKIVTKIVFFNRTFLKWILFKDIIIKSQVLRVGVLS